MALAFTSSTHHLALVVVLVLLLLTVFSPLCLGKCHKDDEAGLLGFKSGITEDTDGLLRSWIPGTDCCIFWSGVYCEGSNHDRVTYLYLTGTSFPNGYLTGTISPSLLKLRQLTYLSLLGLGNLTGSFPKGLFDLPMLKEVYLDDNKLSGQLSFGKNPKSSHTLTGLSLLGNQFTGPIPSSISQFTHLEMLRLHDNKLSSKIPYGIQGLKNLTFLYLQNNQLSGAIPNIFKSLHIQELDLSHNKFSGEIPPSFSFLAPKFVTFNASHNALTGKIPNYFKKLRMLDLSYNQLSGRIPKTKFPIESFVGNDHLCGSPLPSCKK